MTGQTVILLGASNLTLGWQNLVSALRIGLSGPLDVYVAGGMGRSYIATSRFAHRTLPGILESGLWDALQAASSPDTRPVALLTDLGNDLVYKRSPEEVANAAYESIERLRNLSQSIDIVVTRPPRESVESLSWLRFRTFRAFLFPFSGLQLKPIQQAAAELDERLVELAKRQQTSIIRPKREWYGLDPIHVRRNCRVEAFCTMAACWKDWRPHGDHQAADRARMARPVPQSRTSFGREVTTPQPSRRYRDADVHAF